jgi:thioredoxin-dependent adenylylsulfate APS reductase
MSASAPNRVLAGVSPEEILRWTYGNFARVAVVASFQAESSVIIDMISKFRPDFRVLTLDTGRLPQETHDMIDQVRERYRIAIDVMQPDPAEVGTMVATHGTNLFYHSHELRRSCCEVRKSRPLERALRGYDAWITGLRRDQSATRADVEVMTIDAQHGGIAKVAPLAGWSKAQVWDYIHANNVPFHSLYSEGYTSIGCAPCTRATKPGEDERAGRWWWEQDEVKECGIHFPARGGRREESNRTGTQQ